MPISSGALDWPASYYSKPPDKGGREPGEGGDSTPWGAKNSPRGVPPQGYEWQPQLTNREDYEKWRKQMDRKEPLKTRRPNRRGCFGFMTTNKVNKENEDPTKGEQRDSPREVIKRRRRRRCFLLTSCLSVFTFLVMAIFVFVFLHFTGHETLGPQDLVECTGQWRTHFLAWADNSNGTVTYYCCYVPDVKNTTVWATLSQSGWPGGYLISKSECPPPTKTSCEGYTAADFGKVGMPLVPCAACRIGVMSFSERAVFVLLAVLTAALFT